MYYVELVSNSLQFVMVIKLRGNKKQKLESITRLLGECFIETETEWNCYEDCEQDAGAPSPLQCVKCEIEMIYNAIMWLHAKFGGALEKGIFKGSHYVKAVSDSD